MKKLLGFLIKFFLFVVVLWSLAYLVCALYLPSYLESLLLPALQQNTTITYARADIRNIGVFGADLASVVLGDGPDQPAVKIDSIRLDYSPEGIWQSKIDAIVISNAQVRLVYDQHGVSLPGLDLNNLLKNTKDTPAETTSGLELPIAVGQLRFENALLVLDYQGRPYRLSFDLDIVPGTDSSSSSSQVFKCTMTLMPRGTAISLLFDLHLSDNALSCQFSSKSVQLARFADFFETIPDFDLAGEIALQGEVAAQLNPFAVTQGIASISLKRLDLQSGDIHLSHLESKEESVLALQGAGNQWQVRLTGIEALSPVPLHLSQIDCALDMTGESMVGDGSLALNILPGMLLDTGISLQESMALKTTYSFDFDQVKGGTFSFQTTSGLNLSNDQFSALFPNLKIQGSGELAGEMDNDQPASLSYQLSAQHVQVAAGSVAGSGDLELKGTIAQGLDKVWGMSGEVRLSDGQVREEERSILLNGVRGTVPFVWLGSDEAAAGDITVAGMNLDGKELGPLTLELRQKGAGAEFTGQHNNLLVPGLTVDLDGDLQFAPNKAMTASLVATVPPFSLSGLDLADFDLEAEDIDLDGMLGAKALFALDHGSVQGSLELSLDNGSLEMWDPELFVEGVDLSLHVIDLGQMRSAPALLSFSELLAGDRQLDNGSIHFQLESPETILIESSAFQWCGGRLTTNALRLQAGKNDYDFIFSADGLKFSQVLEQFGMKDAEGDGTVNGRIPIRYLDGRLSFDNGFLYSTPGQGGVLKVGGSDILLSGIPANTPQYSQIDFAAEALKDFQYDWVRLSLISEEEEMVLKMNLNGKPGAPLPFAFNQEVGVFSRVKGSGSGGVMQPIRLDVNLRMPLDTVLEYGTEVKDLMDRF